MKMGFAVCRLLAASVILALPGGGPAYAATLSVQVNSTTQAPLEDVIVYLVSNKTAGLPIQAASAQIAQKNKTFIPLVSVVQTGSEVDFPNRDTFRHHVYSFSPAKKFEIKLYADTPSKPVLFDKAGYVVMGCNIHDNMISHLLVVDTPYFAKTDQQGRAKIINVPAGDYALTAWYYPQPEKAALTIPLALKTDTTQTLIISTPSAN